MTIEELYSSHINNPRKWNYYENSSNYSFNDMFPKSSCIGFIKKYLELGEKGDLECISLLGKLDENRLHHIVSAFFLGISIYHQCPNIRNNINTEISQVRDDKLRESSESRFYFLWMITCLFHDFGYIIEDRIKLYRENDIKRIYNNFILKKRPKPFPYRKRTLRLYHEYRIWGMGIIDHGIIGGALLYKELCELRERKEKCHNTKRYWGKELEEDFLYAAWGVACHNIFKSSNDRKSIERYKTFKLDELISNDRLINLNKHALLFLLCLVDSIEPLKQVKDTKLLETIKIDIFDKSIILDIKGLPSPQNNTYVNKIKDLKTWLINIKTNEEQDVFTIEF